MSDSKFHRFYKQFEICLGISIICLPLFWYLVPNVKPGSWMVGLISTEHTTRQLREEHRAEPPGEAIDLEETDLWGTPYRVVPLQDGDVRVVSAGPNGTFDGTAADSDDVYSDMPVTPSESFNRRTKRQWYIAFGATAALWVILYVFLGRPNYVLFGRSEQD